MRPFCFPCVNFASLCVKKNAFSPEKGAFFPLCARSYVLSHSNDPQILPLIEAAVEARTELHPVLRNNRWAGRGGAGRGGGHSGRAVILGAVASAVVVRGRLVWTAMQLVKRCKPETVGTVLVNASNLAPRSELLYLDLALENVVRAAAERGAAASGTQAAAYVGPLLQNLALSGALGLRCAVLCSAVLAAALPLPASSAPSLPAAGGGACLTPAPGTPAASRAELWCSPPT